MTKESGLDDKATPDRERIGAIEDWVKLHHV